MEMVVNESLKMLQENAQIPVVNRIGSHGVRQIIKVDHAVRGTITFDTVPSVCAMCSPSLDRMVTVFNSINSALACIS